MRPSKLLRKQQDDRKKNASQGEVKTLFENSCLRQAKEKRKADNLRKVRYALSN